MYGILLFLYCIGGPSIRRYHILNDKIHVLTKDTNENVSLYNVMQVSIEQRKATQLIIGPHWSWHLFCSVTGDQSRRLGKSKFWGRSEEATANDLRSQLVLSRPQDRSESQLHYFIPIDVFCNFVIFLFFFRCSWFTWKSRTRCRRGSRRKTLVSRIQTMVQKLRVSCASTIIRHDNVINPLAINTSCFLSVNLGLLVLKALLEHWPRTYKEGYIQHSWMRCHLWTCK